MIVDQDLPASTMNVKTHVKPRDPVISLRHVVWRTVPPSELSSAPVLMILSLDLTENVNLKVSRAA